MACVECVVMLSRKKVKRVIKDKSCGLYLVVMIQLYLLPSRSKSSTTYWLILPLSLLWYMAIVYLECLKTSRFSDYLPKMTTAYNTQGRSIRVLVFWIRGYNFISNYEFLAEPSMWKLKNYNFQICTDIRFYIPYLCIK